jgi:hypothetical protein
MAPSQAEMDKPRQSEGGLLGWQPSHGFSGVHGGVPDRFVLRTDISYRHDLHKVADRSDVQLLSNNIIWMIDKIISVRFSR